MNLFNLFLFFSLPAILGMTFINIETLKVASNLETLSYENFKFFPNLQKLFLDNNKIKEISSETFVGNQNLSVINLMYNQISKIDVATFAQLPNLKILYLRNNFCVNQNFENRMEIVNYFRYSEEKCLVGRVLKCLFLKSFFHPINGQIYYCEVFNHQTLFDDIRGLVGNHTKNKNLASVEGFVVNFINCHEIPQNLHKFILNLKVLKITNSILREVNGKTLRNFEKLQWINFEKNKIEKISEGTFSENFELKFINLANNLIKEINFENFVNLKNLEFLKLEGNFCCNKTLKIEFRKFENFIEKNESLNFEIVC